MKTNTVPQTPDNCITCRFYPKGGKGWECTDCGEHTHIKNGATGKCLKCYIRNKDEQTA